MNRTRISPEPHTTWLIVWPVVGVLIFLACASPSGQREYREIKRIPIAEEQRTAFLAYSVDKQIDIFLYSQISVEGGSDTVFRFMVSNGEMKIPTILQRIDAYKGSDPRPKAFLISVLDDIDTRCKCLEQVSGAVDLLRRNTMPIFDDDKGGIRSFKKSYQDTLEKIELRHRESDSLQSKPSRWGE